MEKNYYKILSILPDASPEQIKVAYREMARRYHPDMAKDKDKAKAEEKFKEVAEAYEVLMDSEKRRIYDTYGSERVGEQYWNGDFDWSNFTRFRDLDDILNDMVNNLIRQFMPEIGESIFNEFFEKPKPKKYKNPEQCLMCSGKGIIEIPMLLGLMGLDNCPMCGGSGVTSHKRNRKYEKLVKVKRGV